MMLDHDNSNFIDQYPSTCPECGSNNIVYFGGEMEGDVFDQLLKIAPNLSPNACFCRDCKSNFPKRLYESLR